MYVSSIVGQLWECVVSQRAIGDWSDSGSGSRDDGDRNGVKMARTKSTVV